MLQLILRLETLNAYEKFGHAKLTALEHQDALLSADEEWTQHRKIIETDSRGFRHSMVKDLPYFHVWFGLDSGFGHIIENEKDFPQWFGKVMHNTLSFIFLSTGLTTSYASYYLGSNCWYA